MDNIFNILSNNENQVIAILAFIVLVLSGVIVYQWKYTVKHTVPLHIWELLVGKMDILMTSQREMAIIIKERLRRDQ